MKKLRAEWNELPEEHREAIYRWLFDHKVFILEQQESYLSRRGNDLKIIRSFVERDRACQLALKLLGDKKKDRKRTKFWRL